jgi:transcriptional regulator GlxA family with amidase domain
MPTTKIVFLVLPKIHLLDLAGADQVFYEATDYGADIALDYCSFTDDAVLTSTHLRFGKLKCFSEIALQKSDYLMIPGAEVSYILSSDFKQQNTLFDWIKTAHQNGVNVCSICTGAFVLALAGLLDGKKCTTHWKRTTELQAKFPKTQVLDNILFVEDQGITTSAGVTAGIDLALHIVGKIKNDLFAFKVARELVVYMRRQGNDAQRSVFLQYRNHIHSGVHQVQDWLQEHINQPHTLEDLAEMACMSARNLTRIFRRETGISVNAFTTIIRKEKIRELLKNPDMSRSQIAQACGLKSERQVARLMH